MTGGAPYYRLDRMGLVPMLAAKQVVVVIGGRDVVITWNIEAIDREMALRLNNRRVRQQFSRPRRLVGAGGAMVWELSR